MAAPVLSDLRAAGRAARMRTTPAVPPLRKASALDLIRAGALPKRVPRGYSHGGQFSGPRSQFGALIRDIINGGGHLGSPESRQKIAAHLSTASDSSLEGIAKDRGIEIPHGAPRTVVASRILDDVSRRGMLVPHGSGAEEHELHAHERMRQSREHPHGTSEHNDFATEGRQHFAIAKGVGESPAKAAPKKLTPGEVRLMSMSDPDGLARAAKEGRVSPTVAARELRQAATNIDHYAGILAGGNSDRPTTGELQATAQANGSEAARLRALADEIEARPAKKAPGKRAASTVEGRKLSDLSPEQAAAAARRGDVDKADAAKHIRAQADEHARAAEQLRHPDTHEPDRVTGRQQSIPSTEADRQDAAAKHAVEADRLRRMADRLSPPAKAAPAKKATSRRAGITPHEFETRHLEGTRAGLSDAEAAKYARSDFDTPRAWREAHPAPAKKTAPAKKAAPRIAAVNDPPTPLDKAIRRRYEAGESTSEIGEHEGISPTLAHTSLTRQGVQLRPRGGVKKATPAKATPTRGARLGAEMIQGLPDSTDADGYYGALLDVPDADLPALARELGASFPVGVRAGDVRRRSLAEQLAPGSRVTAPSRPAKATPRPAKDLDELANAISGKSEPEIHAAIADLNGSELTRLAGKFNSGVRTDVLGDQRTGALRFPPGLSTEEKRRWLAQRLAADAHRKLGKEFGRPATPRPAKAATPRTLPSVDDVTAQDAAKSPGGLAVANPYGGRKPAHMSMTGSVRGGDKPIASAEPDGTLRGPDGSVVAKLTPSQLDRLTYLASLPPGSQPTDRRDRDDAALFNLGLLAFVPSRTEGLPDGVQVHGSVEALTRPMRAGRPVPTREAERERLAKATGQTAKAATPRAATPATPRKATPPARITDNAAEFGAAYREATAELRNAGDTEALARLDRIFRDYEQKRITERQFAEQLRDFGHPAVAPLYAAVTGGTPPARDPSRLSATDVEAIGYLSNVGRVSETGNGWVQAVSIPESMRTRLDGLAERGVIEKQGNGRDAVYRINPRSVGTQQNPTTPSGALVGDVLPAGAFIRPRTEPAPEGRPTPALPAASRKATGAPKPPTPRQRALTAGLSPTDATAYATWEKEHPGESVSAWQAQRRERDDLRTRLRAGRRLSDSALAAGREIVSQPVFRSTDSGQIEAALAGYNASDLARIGDAVNTTIPSDARTIEARRRYLATAIADHNRRTRGGF